MKKIINCPSTATPNVSEGATSSKSKDWLTGYKIPMKNKMNEVTLNCKVRDKRSGEMELDKSKKKKEER